MWNAGDRTVVTEIREGIPRSAFGMAYASPGPAWVLACGDMDGTVSAFSARSTRARPLVEGGRGPVATVDVVGVVGNLHLVVGAKDGLFAYSTAATGDRSCRILDPQHLLFHPAASMAGKVVVVHNGTGIVVCVQSMTRARQKTRVVYACVAADGSLARVWDIHTHAFIHSSCVAVAKSSGLVAVFIKARTPRIEARTLDIFHHCNPDAVQDQGSSSSPSSPSSSSSDGWVVWSLPLPVGTQVTALGIDPTGRILIVAQQRLFGSEPCLVSAYDCTQASLTTPPRLLSSMAFYTSRVQDIAVSHPLSRGPDLAYLAMSDGTIQPIGPPITTP